MRNKFNFKPNSQQLINKKILRVFLPGKWSLALFLVVFIMFFAWGTTFDKNSNQMDISISIESPGAVSYSPVFPWHPNEQNFAVLLVGEIVPIIGQFNLLWNIAHKSSWLGTYYNTLNYNIKDYVSILANYYCILISFEVGILFSLSLFRRNAKKDELLDSGSLVLYRSIIMLIIVFIFNYW